MDIIELFKIKYIYINILMIMGKSNKEDEWIKCLYEEWFDMVKLKYY